jgi:hypothetical protein
MGHGFGKIPGVLMRNEIDQTIAGSDSANGFEVFIIGKNCQIVLNGCCSNP